MFRHIYFFVKRDLNVEPFILVGFLFTLRPCAFNYVFNYWLDLALFRRVSLVETCQPQKTVSVNPWNICLINPHAGYL